MSGDGAIVAIGSVGLVALVAAVLVGISNNPQHDYAQVCQNADYVRLEDTNCGNNGSFVMFISTNSNYNVPPVGGRLDQSRLVKSVPSGKTIQQSAAVPKEGGVVKSSSYITRGGFGSSSGGSSGG